MPLGVTWGQQFSVTRELRRSAESLPALGPAESACMLSQFL